jgi:hypothetical protein
VDPVINWVHGPSDSEKFLPNQPRAHPSHVTHEMLLTNLGPEFLRSKLKIPSTLAYPQVSYPTDKENLCLNDTARPYFFRLYSNMIARHSPQTPIAIDNWYLHDKSVAAWAAVLTIPYIYFHSHDVYRYEVQ